MKITKQQYQEMKAAIAPLAEKAKQHREYIIAEGKAKDIEKRLRWDCLYAAKINCTEMYNSGCNDNHIDTALRNIMKELVI